MQRIKYYAIVDQDTKLVLTFGTYSSHLPENSLSVNNPEDYIFAVSDWKIEKDNTITFINQGDAYNNYLKENMREKRNRYLPAFDLWEKAVVRGREEDSSEIMQWYRDMLDLKPDAFKDENIPDKIKYYLGGN